MKIPTIFEDFNTQIRRIYDEWEEFDKKITELMNNPDESSTFHRFISQYQNYYDSRDSNKNYALSYKYETGMAEPEIKIEGDVDDKTINRFVEGVKDRFQTSHLSISNIKKSKVEKKPSLKQPPTLPKEKVYTLEMPGIGLTDVETELNGNIMTVKGEKDNLKYTKKIILPFNTSQKPEITTDNGIIHVKVMRE